MMNFLKKRAVKYVFLLLLLVYVVPYLVQMVCIILLPKRVSVLSQLSLYQYLSLGALIYVIFHRYVKKNVAIFEVQAHEWAHGLVSILTFNEVISVHAEQRSGVIYSTGSSVAQVLAPYCLPYITYMLVALRPLIAYQGLWIYDILVGISLAFHLTCFWLQTGNWQTDINQFPTDIPGLPHTLAYLHIWTFRLFNAAILLVAFFPGYNLLTSFTRFLKVIPEYTMAFIHWF